MAVPPPGYEQLQPADLEAVYRRLAEKGAQLGPCELCGTKKWAVFDTVISPKVLLRNAETQALKEWENKSFNQIVFSCSNCGNSKFIELHFLGLSLSTPLGSGDE